MALWEADSEIRQRLTLLQLFEVVEKLSIISNEVSRGFSHSVAFPALADL